MKKEKKAVITVVGPDKTGIIAAISTLLASHEINILETNQTTRQGLFTMFMLADLEKSTLSIADLADKLKKLGSKIGQEIHAQDEKIIKAMHRI